VGAVLQWDVASGEKIRSTGGCSLVAFSPDGRTIATLRNPDSRDVRMTDAETGILRLRIVCSQATVYSVCFSVDGSKLATGGGDGSCKVWDSSTGALLRFFHFGNADYSVAWGRDWLQDTQQATAFAHIFGGHPSEPG
jgi:WD40 repeat protein